MRACVCTHNLDDISAGSDFRLWLVFLPLSPAGRLTYLPAARNRDVHKKGTTTTSSSSSFPLAMPKIKTSCCITFDGDDGGGGGGGVPMPDTPTTERVKNNTADFGHTVIFDLKSLILYPDKWMGVKLHGFDSAQHLP